MLLRAFRIFLWFVTQILPSRAEWLARHILPHEAGLRRWLERRATRGADTDDAIQEAYARLATLPAVDHITNPRSYFYRTVCSMLVNEARRRRVVSIETLGEFERLSIEALDLPPDRQAESRQELRRVGEAIAELPPKCREAFILRKVHGLSQREAAERLGISESTLEKHVGRGIAHLVRTFGRGGKLRDGTSSVRVPDADVHHEARIE